MPASTWQPEHSRHHAGRWDATQAHVGRAMHAVGSGTHS
jgi:hypothetical protein